MCVCFAFNAMAALRTGNSGTGRGGTYATLQASSTQSISAQELIENAQTSAELGLPVRVSDMALARMIAANNTNAGVTMEQLDACAEIYPTGAWAWDVADVGSQSEMGCVADVELRMVSGSDDVVLATARVAPGGAIKCNVSEFPSASYTESAGTVIFPADAEPTRDEIVAVMNKEQKQNAGMKIAAATIIGGLAGNFVGQNDPGKGGALGTSNDKMNKTAIGALALGGLTAVSTQAGKVGGDVILGATVNAAGGGLIGNISGIGDPVLLIRKCEGTDCLYGYVAKNIKVESPNYGFMGDKGTHVKCTQDEDNYSSCGTTDFEYWSLKGVDQNTTQQEKLDQALSGEKFCLKGKKMESSQMGCDGQEIFYVLDTASEQGKKEAAVITEWNTKLKTKSDFKTWRTENANSDIPVIRYRYSDGTIGKDVGDDFSAANFTPLTQDATDGSIIDFNNKARTKSTVTGAGVGAGLGGFSAYQGATTDVENRWVAEVQSYKDSLTKFYCATGKRFLSQYNEMAIIPAVTE